MLKSWPPLARYWTRHTRVTLALLTLVSLPSSAIAQHTEQIAEVEFALESADTQAPTFFTRPQYRGTAVALPVGDYALADLVAHGIADNTISSLRVAPGFKVEAFANGNFTGTSIIVSGDTPALAARQFDNQLSSVRISQLPVGATFYEFCDRGGYAVSLPVGQYTRQHLARWGIGDNAVSGVMPARGKEVEIFTRESFKSRSRLVNKATLCLTGGGLDNATSSLRIRSSPVLFKDDFNSGSLANWDIATGFWDAVNGAMVGIGEGGDIDAWSYHAPTQDFTGNIAVDVNLNMVNGNGVIIINSTGPGVRDNEYFIGIWPSNGDAYQSRWQIVRARNHEFDFSLSQGTDVVDGLVKSPIPIPAKCTVTVRRLGNKFDLYINGIRIGSATDPDPLPAQGRVGVGVSWDRTAVFDNFVVRK